MSVLSRPDSTVRRAARTIRGILLAQLGTVAVVSLVAGCASSSGAVPIQAIEARSTDGAPGTLSAAARGESTRLMGRVFRRVKPTAADTATLKPVEGAAIVTEPKTAQYNTDAQGVFLIEHNVSQRQYRVLVEFEDLKGRSQYVRAEANKTVNDIIIILGDGESAWPPPAVFQSLIPNPKVVNSVPGQVRRPEFDR